MGGDIIKILIFGYRNWKSINLIEKAILRLIEKYQDIVIIEGECPTGGADILAIQIALKHEIPCICHHFRRGLNWKKLN